MKLFDRQRLHFLYPNAPYQLGTADDHYAPEMNAVQNAGFSCSTISIEDLERGVFRLRPRIPEGATVVYRGWMLNAQTHTQLVNGILASNAHVLTDTPTYLKTHHLPNWYEQIADLTPETRVFTLEDDLESALRSLGWEGFFIKDYVKSLKTSVGSVISKPEQAAHVLAEMQKFRGAIEGGIVVRRLEEIDPASERRYFVIAGQPFAASGEPPEVVQTCASRIDVPFFSVDVALRADDVLRVIELGDGQVSDLVGWTPERFAHVWLEVIENASAR
jgi:hypothetical protein